VGSRPPGSGPSSAAGPDEATAIATGDEISARTQRSLTADGEDSEHTQHATRVRGASADPLDDGTSVDPTGETESPFDLRLEHYTSTQHGPGELVAGRYRVLSEIGQGSMGRIFLAEQVSVGRRVALKIINREMTAKFDMIARFTQEARLLASVRNEHIVDIYDIGETETGDPFIAMEFVDGPPLAQIIRDEGPLEAARVVRLLLQIASALATVHAAGVVHRDLKPANIVILTRKDGFEIAKILDFGLAKVVHDREAAGRLTRAGVIIGTPEYMSPEQVTATEVDHRADLYALGCTAYDMLTGHPPFIGPEMSTLYKHMHEDAAPMPGVPDALAKVVARCLAKDPARRFQSARELHTALVVAAEAAGISRASLRVPRSSLDDPGEAEAPERALPHTRLEYRLAVAVALVLGLIGGVFAARALGGGAAAEARAQPAPTTVAATAALVVTSVPEGATVSVDGAEGKPSPVVIKALPPGQHQVKLVKRGWRDVVRVVDLGAGQASTLEVTLERPRYTMKIESQPAGADVTIDGSERGRTPLTLDVTEAEFHEILVRKEGFRPKTVFVAPELSQPSLHVALEPQLLEAGSLVVDSEHAGRVFIDGKDTGEWTPTGDIQLAPGTYKIELVDGLGARRSATAKVVAGDVTLITVPPP
jgi:tRNA A-37 threonylcarbamoyl transferase component Bud32